MKIKISEKMIGQSWQKWFYENLSALGFSRIRTSTYANEEGTEVRILRHKKKYQVLLNGQLSKELEFNFPYLTGRLCP